MTSPNNSSSQEVPSPPSSTSAETVTSSTDWSLLEEAEAEAKGRQEEPQTHSAPSEDTRGIGKQALTAWLCGLDDAQGEGAEEETGQGHGSPARQLPRWPDPTTTTTSSSSSSQLSLDSLTSAIMASNLATTRHVPSPAPRTFKEEVGQQPAAPLDDASTEYQRYYAKRRANRVRAQESDSSQGSNEATAGSNADAEKFGYYLKTMRMMEQRLKTARTNGDHQQVAAIAELIRSFPTNNDEVLRAYQTEMELLEQERRDHASKARVQVVAPRVTWLGVGNPPINSPQDQQGVGQVDGGNHTDGVCKDSTQQSNLDGSRQQPTTPQPQPAPDTICETRQMVQELQTQLMLLEQKVKELEEKWMRAPDQDRLKQSNVVSQEEQPITPQPRLRSRLADHVIHNMWSVIQDNRMRLERIKEIDEKMARARQDRLKIKEELARARQDHLKLNEELTRARQDYLKQSQPTTPQPQPVNRNTNHTLQDYQTQLWLLEQKFKKDRIRVHNQDSLEKSRAAIREYQMQLLLLRHHVIDLVRENKKNMMEASQEQDRLEQSNAVGQEQQPTTPQPQPDPRDTNHILQEHQRQLMLLEQKIKQRIMEAYQEQDRIEQSIAVGQRQQLAPAATINCQPHRHLQRIREEHERRRQASMSAPSYYLPHRPFPRQASMSATMTAEETTL
jgi:hypothetical protein